MIFIILIFGNVLDILLQHCSIEKLALITIREIWGLDLKLSGLGLGFYDKVSVSSQNLSQVSVSEVAVSTTSLQPAQTNGEQRLKRLWTSIGIALSTTWKG